MFIKSLIKNRPTWPWKTRALILFPILIAFFSIITSDKAWVEQYYSKGIYPYISMVLSSATFWLPFSLGQVLVFLFIGYTTYSLIQTIRKILKYTKKERQALLASAVRNILFWTMAIYGTFMLLWGINYSRKPILEENASVLSAGVLDSMCVTLIKLTNINKSRADNLMAQKGGAYTIEEIFQKAPLGYKAAPPQYPIIYYNRQNIKALWKSRFMSAIGVGGIYSPFTGEANINVHMPQFLVPATTCHEMAHQIGFASEQEANYISFITCLYHPDAYFNYSGSLMGAKYALREMNKINEDRYNELVDMFSDGVKEDLDTNKKYWAQFISPLDKYSDAIYDMYLKANKQELGMQSYNMVVMLLLQEYQKNGFHKQ